MEVKRGHLRVMFAIVLFLVAVVLLEGNGYLIHHDLYEYGLQYSQAWAEKDNLIKIVLYQFVILTITLIHKSWSVLILTEIFWITSTQDLIFYLIWNGGVFPEGNWTWMPFFSVFGNWTTTNQLVLSITSIFLSGFLLWFLKRWNSDLFEKILSGK